MIYKSIKKSLMRVSIHTYGKFLEYMTDVIYFDIKTLVGVEKMKEPRWYVNELSNKLCDNDNINIKMSLKFFRDQFWLTWPVSVLFSFAP